MINYVIAADVKGRFLVIDIRGGFECRIFCETDTHGKAQLIANLLNRHGDDRGAPRSFVDNDRNNSKPNSREIPDPETSSTEAEAT